MYNMYIVNVVTTIHSMYDYDKYIHSNITHTLFCSAERKFAIAYVVSL